MNFLSQLMVELSLQIRWGSLPCAPMTVTLFGKSIFAYDQVQMGLLGGPQFNLAGVLVKRRHLDS